MEDHRSEKLAQEGLRGNRDRFAVGKRVGSCVWKVSHYLESVRGAGGLLHQNQTIASARMVITKLFNELEWYSGFKRQYQTDR